jgi:hypothetical protein
MGGELILWVLAGVVAARALWGLTRVALDAVADRRERRERSQDDTHA